MDHLWRHIKGDVWANAPYHSLDEGVTQIHQYLPDIGPAGWMRKAGLFSEKFWLREYCVCLSVKNCTSLRPAKTKGKIDEMCN